MKPRLITCLVIGCLALWFGQAHAVSLTLGPLGGPLALTVGDTAGVTVDLGDLAGGSLVSLGGTVLFPGGLLGTPFNEVAGAIVPNPGDLTLSPVLGTIDAQFFAMAGDPISSEGRFFAFQVRALAPGSGVISFEPLSLFAEDGIGPPIFDIATNDLAFSVRPRGDGQVPQPATGVLILVALAGLIASRGRGVGDPRRR